MASSCWRGVDSRRRAGLASPCAWPRRRPGSLARPSSWRRGRPSSARWRSFFGRRLCSRPTCWRRWRASATCVFDLVDDFFVGAMGSRYPAVTWRNPRTLTSSSIERFAPTLRRLDGGARHLIEDPNGQGGLRTCSRPTVHARAAVVEHDWRTRRPDRHDHPPEALTPTSSIRRNARPNMRSSSSEGWCSSKSEGNGRGHRPRWGSGSERAWMGVAECCGDDQTGCCRINESSAAAVSESDRAADDQPT